MSKKPKSKNGNGGSPKQPDSQPAAPLSGNGSGHPPAETEASSPPPAACSPGAAPQHQAGKGTGVGIRDLKPGFKTAHLLGDLQRFLNAQSSPGDMGKVRSAGFGPTVDEAPLFVVTQCVVEGGPFPLGQMDLTFRGQAWGTISPDGTLHLPQEQPAGGGRVYNHDDPEWEMLAYLALEDIRFNVPDEGVDPAPPAEDQVPGDPTA